MDEENQTTSSQNNKINSPASIAFAVVALLWVCYVSWSYNQQTIGDKKLAQSFKDAPTIELADIDKSCDSNTPIVLRLLTQKTDSFAEAQARPGKPAPKPMVFREFRRVVATEDAHGTHVKWLHVAQDPAEIIFLNPDKKIRVRVETKDLDMNVLPTVFLSEDPAQSDVELPKQWLDATQKGAESDYPQYKISAVPCDTRVMVRGILSKIADGYQMRGAVTRRHKYRVSIKIEPGQEFADE